MPDTPSDRTPPARDDVFWLAVRAAYAAGVPADRASSIFGIARSTLLRRARKENWSARGPGRDATDDAIATLAAEIPAAEEVLRAVGSSPTLDEAAPDAASIVPKTLAAADAALFRATEAAACADADGAESASKLAERLARMANVLGRMKAPPMLKDPFDDKEKRQTELLAQIDRALEGDRDARRIEVAELKLRGIDPRKAWLWDDEDGEWVWNPGEALAASVATPPPSDDDAPAQPDRKTQD